MEVGPNIRQFTSQDNFIKQKQLLANAKPASIKEAEVLEKASAKIKPFKEKIDISKTAKQLAKSQMHSEVVGKGASLVKSVADGLGGIPTSKIKDASEIKKIEKSNTLMKPIKKPAVIFIGGFDWMGLSSSNQKLEQMSDYIKDAKYYDYSERNKIMSEIKKRHSSQPIIIVGRGLGGDLAKEISSELNSMKNGFKKVDLLVTIDSSSMSRDIISQNVAKNINLIDESGFFNDGPNIAKNDKRTYVSNQLFKNNILDSKEVQFELFNNINAVLGDTNLQNHLAQKSVYNMKLDESFRELRR